MRPRPWIAAAAPLLILLTAIGLQYPRWSATFAADRVYFIDPDDYTRMTRVGEILSGAALRVGRMPQIDAPGVVELHWTAPMDYLLAIPAGLFARFVKHPDPAACIAACVPVALGIAYLLNLMRITRRGFGRSAGLLAGLMAVLSPGFHRAFQLGHPDHHGLLALLLLAAVGCWLPTAEPGDERRPQAASVTLCGVAMALAVWVSVEALLVWAVTLIGLTWIAARRGDVEGRALSAARDRWSASALATLFAALLLERVPQVITWEADKISLLHVGLFAAVFHVQKRLGRGPGGWRPLAGLIALFVGVGIILFASGSALLGPLADPRYPRWTTRLMEFQPLVAHAGGDWSLRPMIESLGFLPCALPVLLGIYLLSPRTSNAGSGVFGLLAPALTGAALFQLRWLDHVNLALIPVTAASLTLVARGVIPGSHRHGRLLRGAASVAALILLIAPSAAALLKRTRASEFAAMSVQHRAAAAADTILRHRIEHPAAPDTHSTILCEEGDGPALLYWTGLPVVAAPYHRALDGIADAAAFFATRDAAEASRIITSRRVGFIVLPARIGEQLVTFERIAFGTPRSVVAHQRLGRHGEIRETLEFLPGFDQTTAYRLFVGNGLESSLAPHGWAIRDLRRIREGAKTGDGLSGFVYSVEPQSAAP